jgi:lysophospholipase L1-like esterase
VLSDPVDASVPADTTLAVSFHVVGESGPITGHDVATQTSYVSGSAGADVAGEESGTAFTTEISSWYWVESVVIEKPRRVKTVVLFGDSITDGNGSTVGADRRYPDVLADRVAASSYAGRFGMMNEGISANRVLVDSTGGQRGLDRFRRDVLDQPGVSTVVLMEGINDIRWDDADEASDLIVAYRELIAQAHAEDVCVVGATLTPYEGGSRYTPARDRVRVAVNEWIRTSGEFDGVVDFDAATRDPERPARFLPAYDSGDHLHPGDAGYAAMAEAVDLRLLECDR